MYTKGKLDVTDLPSEDRLQVFSELSDRAFNMQIEMKSGRTYVTTQVLRDPRLRVLHFDPVLQYASRLYLCGSGRYVVRYRNISQDWTRDPNISHVGTEEHEDTAGYCHCCSASIKCTRARKSDILSAAL